MLLGIQLFLLLSSFMFNLDIEFGIVVASNLKKQMKNNQNLCHLVLLWHRI